MNRSLPNLQPCSTNSTETSTESIEENKTLVAQRSFPNLRLKNKRSIGDDISKYANEKRNHDFHVLFRSIPGEERLIEDYGCALQKEILLQGRMYISQNHICFNANIFGWITNLVIAFTEIEYIEKRSTAIFIPNAILISTADAKYFFGSFLSRDHAYDQMMELWKQSRQSTTEDEDDTAYTSSSSFDQDRSLLNQSTMDERQISLASLPAQSNVKVTESIRRRAMSEAQVAARPNLQNFGMQQIKEKTTCDCSKNEQHFPTVVMDNVYDNTTIETLYHLLYSSTFMHQFLTQVEKSTEVCIGQWTKVEECEGIEYTRKSSYIKYLGGTIGPKSTKCYLKEDMIHLDTTNYISQLTVTQTPDVPSGSSFHVKTRTCISYAGHCQVRVLVTVLVEFTKSSWLKSTIEKASIDGQQNFYKSLDVAIRKYLDQHQDNHHKRKRNHRHKSSHKPSNTIMPSHQKQTSIQIPNWIFNIKPAQIVIFCMTMMIFTNIYIATKISKVDKRLGHLYSQDSDSWTHPIPGGEENDWLLLSKHKLDQQMVELDKMIKRASKDIHQITKTARYQRDRLFPQ
ncbi:GRAM-domain-containing protein [Rhizopus microsporus ATCC 52813]|uniref:GRAM-domain-containing protein n=2 Tax=Rhizopus microsporus TaxID=58291 RepID=A0A2G4SHB9_RHIZD|nr:GRAM-domain-containing protein [Rhizopus microsporus ATCC 52813]PHZ08170.1 GRAM-domain-containing protein [Rhizopus microsporus ATCC 52813]